MEILLKLIYHIADTMPDKMKYLAGKSLSYMSEISLLDPNKNSCIWSHVWIVKPRDANE